MKRSWLVIAALAGLGVLTSVPAQAQPDSTPEFAIHAAQDNLAEVELGRLAMQRAQSPAVQQFGQRMVTDHGKAVDELQQLARSKGMSLPTTLRAEHATVRDRLATLSGADFDRAYMDEMVTDHVKDVAKFERAAQQLDDPDARAWAATTLPTLRDHLAQARSIHAQVAGGPGAPAASLGTAGPAPPAAVSTTTVVIVPRPAPAAAIPWCSGQWAPGAGTNFGSCPGR